MTRANKPAKHDAYREVWTNSIQAAARAVVAHHLGVRVDKASTADEGSNGDGVRCVFPPEWPDDIIEDVRAVIICAAHHGLRLLAGGATTAQAARINAQAARAVGGSATRFRRANDRAREMVRKHGYEVFRVAADLLQWKVVSGAGIVAAIKNEDGVARVLRSSPPEQPIAGVPSTIV